MEIFSETEPAGNNREADQKRVQTDKQYRNLPNRLRQAALAHVGVYLDCFICVVQGVPE